MQTAAIIPQIRVAIERIGWSEAARLSGIERTTLHRAFGNHPRRGTTLSTIEQLLPALGLELVVRERGQ